MTKSYSNFLLGEDDSTVFPANTDRGDVGRGDGLESIF